MDFEFLDTAGLADDEITLVPDNTSPAEPDRDYVPAYHFSVVRTQDSALMGGLDLRIGDNEKTWYGGNIGYWVNEPYRGHHYAEKASRLAFKLAARHGMKRIIITCDPDNYGSRRTCERLGGTLLEIADVPPDTLMYAQGEHQKCIYEYLLNADGTVIPGAAPEGAGL